jgi:hypothetical protein
MDISITQSSQIGASINIFIKVVYAEERAGSHHYTITTVIVGHTVTGQEQNS